MEQVHTHLVGLGTRVTYYGNGVDTLRLEAIELWGEGEQVLPKAILSLGLPFYWI